MNNVETTNKDGSYLDSIIAITNDKKMIADGPLALQYTKALNAIYKKDTDEQTGITLESQANDEIVSKSIWATAETDRSKIINDGNEVGMLYGVAKDSVSISDVINITDAVGGMIDSEKENSVIILDTKYNTNNTGDITLVNPFVNTIEQIALENNIQLCSSLEEYTKSTKLLDGKWSGTISGNKVKFEIDGKVHKFTNDEGIKEKNMPCIVVIKNNDVHSITVKGSK